jgi:hypothetical protein
MVRAFSSSDPIRAMTAGSRNRAGAWPGALAIVTCRSRCGHRVEQPRHDGVGDLFGLGVEVRHDAVTQRGVRQRPDVAHRHA